MLPFCKVELLEFTGLKDKNGKDIYEGDILHKEGYWNIYIVWDDKHSRFGAAATDWIVTQGKNNAISREELLEYRVIGNVYENPELL